jgi:2-hydroxychromene-2-carboxylate isomerase
MADVEFFWDPACPWAWITSRWMLEVADQRPLEIDWKFISLRFVNKDKDYATEFPEHYERIHTQGLRLLRVAAAVRESAGRKAVGDLYTAYGEIIHDARDRDSIYDTPAIADVLDRLGHKRELAEAADTTDHDDVILAETTEALDRCGGFVGTPVISFAPPDGPSFFGPVLSRVPKGQEALDLWDAAVTLGRYPHFAELKRTERGKPDPSR